MTYRSTMVQQLAEQDAFYGINYAITEVNLPLHLLIAEICLLFYVGRDFHRENGINISTHILGLGSSTSTSGLMSLGGICRIEHAVGVGVNGAGGRQKARRSIRMRALPELEASQAVLVAATALALVGGVFGGRFVAYSQTQVARAG